MSDRRRDTTAEIRPATLKDAPELARYYAELLAERLPFVLENPPPTLEQEQAFVRDHAGDDALLLVAHVGARVVGLSAWRVGRHPQHAHVCAFGISVAAPYRGNGLGTRLIAQGEAWCRRRGSRRIELEVIDGNPAVALYERLGFQHEGRRRGAVTVGDEDRDVLLLAKRLASGSVPL